MTHRRGSPASQTRLESRFHGAVAPALVLLSFARMRSALAVLLLASATACAYPGRIVRPIDYDGSGADAYGDLWVYCDRVQCPRSRDAGWVAVVAGDELPPEAWPQRPSRAALVAKESAQGGVIINGTMNGNIYVNVPDVPGDPRAAR